MTAATRRELDADDVQVLRPDAEPADGWHIDLGDSSRFDHVVDGVVVDTAFGAGFAEFDSFVSRFAPTGYSAQHIRDLVALHRSGPSAIAFRVSTDARAGILVGASYKSTIDEIIGAVWEGSCEAIADAAVRAGVRVPVLVQCAHPTADLVTAALAEALVSPRQKFVHSLSGTLDAVAEVLADE
ncbi:hypothetical protein [Rhodococcoides yunnanense]|uniref:Uncharacterized protein n=1 Tax=Rhodococcoides yunnanense TaxID=278209 RepID=A0ABU4BHP6_9NOCA|nr:hypothetical protein [Rhodococcus yunnanensis]MDV6263718.1 hypothetical protein [Rhodococcus yunnanensis]